MAREAGDGWSEAERLIASCEFSLRVLRWQPTEDGHMDRNRPTHAIPPRERPSAASGRGYTEEDMEAIAEALGIPQDRR